MTDEDVVDADPYDGKTNAELKDELRSRGLSTAGNKDELLARLADADAAPEDLTKAKLIERAESLGIEGFPTSGSKQEMIDAINAADVEEDDTPDVADPAAQQADLTGRDQAAHDAAIDEISTDSDGSPSFDQSGLSTEQADAGLVDRAPDAVAASRAGLIDTHRAPDGTSLTDNLPEGRRFEPADVAGPADEGSYNEYDARSQAQLAARAADARAAGIVDEQLDGPQRMSDVDASPDNDEFDEADFPEGGFAEHTLPMTDRRQAQLAAWADANPDATVIPPSLLPAAYQDPTISTPGLPGGPVVR